MTIPYQPETCQPSPSVFRRGGYNVGLPRDCSCYLTSTKACGPASTTWKTVHKPTSTATVTKHQTVTILKPSTKTVDTLRSSTSLAALLSTHTSTTALTITQTSTSTSTTTSTTTTSTTTTTTALETVQADPCAAPTLYTEVRPTHPLAIVGVRSDSNTPRDCCYRCYGSNAGCLFWKWSGYVCSQYVIPYSAPATECVTGTCRRGRPALEGEVGDGATYGTGICSDGSFAGDLNQN